MEQEFNLLFYKCFDGFDELNEQCQIDFRILEEERAKLMPIAVFAS